ncbi:pirin family protein [Terrimonas sp. NA20]|uniref:Pirin family protein n=1 Tax=Terrimonas ginsenosidimutans TaxID=2908004 RepID=A0ABS9KX01_9BACT|nr:pirin family protein [Terrimonas ginsenosidimutans]MCG2616764.1 pirin family protein [Terrimonas ginsenosidimutans]
MKQSDLQIYGGVNAQVGEFLVNRLLPGKPVDAVGPVVFLDHIYPMQLKTVGETIPTGDLAHPHRGIATFSYVLSGKLTHYDSRGNRNTISAGGIQWMNAGNGIIHDEQPFADETSGPLFHSLQCWINLPAAVKAKEPAYMSLQSQDIPVVTLPEGAGELKILLGVCGDTRSPVRTFSEEFVYHLRLSPRSRFSLPAKQGIEYAAFVPAAEVMVNGESVSESKIAIFGNHPVTIGLENPNVDPVDLLLFGGRPYMEPIVAEGPFVMNSRNEIADAYRDFFQGKYGEIDYTITQTT